MSLELVWEGWSRGMRGLGLTIVACLLASFVVAGPGAVSPSSDAKVILNALRFDRNLARWAEHDLSIVVVCDAEARAECDELASAFDRGGEARVQGRPVRAASTLATDIDEIASVCARAACKAVYLHPSAEDQLGDLRVWSTSQQVVILAGSPELVAAGAALGVDHVDGRPGLVVNLDVARRHGLDLEASLLKMARVVRSRGEPEMVEPVLLDFKRPRYTREAEAMRVQGVVLIRVLVDEEGSPLESRLLRGLPNDLGLNQASLDAAGRARFAPGRRDGRPAQMWYTLKVSFQLQQ